MQQVRCPQHLKLRRVGALTHLVVVCVCCLVINFGVADAQLAVEWVARYNGPGNDWDSAEALAVDGSGNVYATGRSRGSGSEFDYATLKYSPTGDTLWVRRYNGPGNGDDIAFALALDGTGNVYVISLPVNIQSGCAFVVSKVPLRCTS